MSDEIAKTSQTSLEVINATMATQMIQAALVYADKKPRDMIKARDRAIEQCKRETLARTAIYSYPRGGTNIEGPSIRLAEVAAQSWGNMQYGIGVIDRRETESVLLAYAWDLETNTMARREFIVKHIRDTKKGSYELTDERDIYEATANAGSRRLRACILQLIPGDVIEACMDRCRLTLEQSMGKLEEAIPKMIAKFEEFSVTKAMIEARVKKSVESLSYSELVYLGSVYNSLKDGMGAVGDYFEAPSSPPPDKMAEARAAAAKMAAKATERQKPESRKEGQGATQKPPAAPDPVKPPSDAVATPLRATTGNPGGQSLAAEVQAYIRTVVPAPDRPWFQAYFDGCKGNEEELKVLMIKLKANYDTEPTDLLREIRDIF